MDNVLDTSSILAFHPERLGHALHLVGFCFVCNYLITLPQTNDHVCEILKAGIPVEVCPASNLATLHLDSLSEHPTLAAWLRYALCALIELSV